jgi:predicted CXXCH cytochrome family protein
VISVLLALAVGAGPDVESFEPDDCAGCHAALEPEVAVGFLDGSERGARVPRDALEGSIHQDLGCVDCHPGPGPYPHPDITHAVPRDLERALAEGCQRCHAEVAERMRDGIHGQLGQAGHPEVATCVDCHGGHDVTTPGEPRAAISELCGRCHEEVLDTYEASVHGAGVAEGSEATPTCTSCHGAHAIRDPESRAWRASHQMCAECHRDPARMAEHDLSPDVVRTYLDDFHGMSNELFLESGRGSREVYATCSGCHGFHDVERLGDLASEAEREAKIDAMCRRCHEGAPDSFSDAWMGHRDIDAATAPFAWLIEWVYIFMIPIILVALVVHILLDLSQARAREMLRRRRRE